MLYNWGQTHISNIIRLEVLRSNHLHQEQQQCFTSRLYSSWFTCLFKDQMCNMLLLFAIVVLLNTVSDQRCWKRRKMWHNFNSFVGSSLLIRDITSKEMKNNSSRLNSWLTNWKFIGSYYELQLKKKKKTIIFLFDVENWFSLVSHKWLCHSVCHYADDRMSLRS